MANLLSTSLLTTLTFLPAMSIAQVWQPVHEGAVTQSAWSEVVCTDGGGWQMCDMPGITAKIMQTVMSRDLFDRYPNQTVTVKLIARGSGYVKTGNDIAYTGNYSDAGMGFANIFEARLIGKPHPDHWKKSSGCSMSSSYDCDMSGFGIMTGYKYPSVKLYFPASFQVSLSRKFSDVGAQFGWDYSANGCSSSNTIARIPLHSEAHNSAFNQTPYCRHQGFMSAGEHNASSTAHFMVPEPVNLTVRGVIEPANGISAAEISAWAGLPIDGQYRIELDVGKIYVDDVDVDYNQDMVGRTVLNLVEFIGWKATLVGVTGE